LPRTVFILSKIARSYKFAPLTAGCATHPFPFPHPLAPQVSNLLMSALEISPGESLGFPRAAAPLPSSPMFSLQIFSRSDPSPRAPRKEFVRPPVSLSFLPVSPPSELRPQSSVFRPYPPLYLCLSHSPGSTIPWRDCWPPLQ